MILCEKILLSKPQKFSNPNNTSFQNRTQTFTGSFVKKKTAFIDGNFNGGMVADPQSEYIMGHAYLDKINRDDEKRNSKLHNDMQVYKDQISDLQKDNNSHMRHTFYNCLGNGNYDPQQDPTGGMNINNNSQKIDEFVKFELQNRESNILNSSNAFNKTNIQFRKTLTSDVLAPIPMYNEQQLHKNMNENQYENYYDKEQNKKIKRYESMENGSNNNSSQPSPKHFLRHMDQSDNFTRNDINISRNSKGFGFKKDRDDYIKERRNEQAINDKIRSRISMKF